LSHIQCKRRSTKAASDGGLALLGQSVIDDAMNEWHKRLCSCQRTAFWA